MGSDQKSSAEDLRHIESMQLSIVRFALTVYTILGAVIAGLYSVSISFTDPEGTQLGFLRATQQSGLDLPELGSWAFFIGGIAGIVFLVASSLNWWRFYQAAKLAHDQVLGSCCSVALNLIPALAFLPIILFCWLYQDSLFTK